MFDLRVKHWISRRPNNQPDSKSVANILLSLILNLRMIATSFQGDKAHAEQIRNVSLWPESDAQELKSLAVSFGPQATELAAEASRHLATIRELAIGVQQTPTSMGVDWNKFPWNRWSSAIQGAERCLLSVVSIIEPPRPRG
jgi:hypothetical protein